MILIELGKVVQESVDMVLATYARLIQTLKKQIKELEKSIVALFEVVTEAQCLKSVPGNRCGLCRWYCR